MLPDDHVPIQRRLRQFFRMLRWWAPILSFLLTFLVTVLRFILLFWR